MTPPVLGIGALFPVTNIQIKAVSEASSKRTCIQETADFFVDAFWTAKVGGGTSQLSRTQQQSLQQSQAAEFTKRYGGKGRVAELFVCKQKDKVIACAGVEVDRIPDGSLKGPIVTRAPLMSNLAVSRQYRKRGLAVQLVKQVEQHVQQEWGYDECYLYVEQRNRAAIKLYQKLGYKQLWTDSNAKTLLPTSDGRLDSTTTTLVCMRKDLKKSPNFFVNIFG